jgi:uncharacterized protein YegL
VELEKLTGTDQYTIVEIVKDISGSVYGYATELQRIQQEVIKALKKSPRVDNLLIRNTSFNSNGIVEDHGYDLLADIDESQYPVPRCGGGTPLYDATFQSVKSMHAFGSKLWKKEFTVNGLIFVITDGSENYSHIIRNASEVKDAVNALMADEEALEEINVVLIGVNINAYRKALEDFQKESGIVQFIDIETADESSIAKIIGFISRSVSSSSQALLTGGKSQQVSISLEI